MVPIVATVLVAHDLSSRYCPIDRGLFVARVALTVGTVACIALLLFAVGRFKRLQPNRRMTWYIAACAVALFAAGSGALVIFGLSGCGGATEAGLTWDWPW